MSLQVSLLAYRLLGGSAGNPTLQPFSHPSRYQPGNAANMFTYSGPRRVKVAGLWDEQMLYAAAHQDLLKDVHLLVGTPEHLARVATSGNLRLHQLQALVIDEADVCLPMEATSQLMRRLEEACGAFAVPRPQLLLAGASISASHVEQAARRGWVQAPLLVSPTRVESCAAALLCRPDGELEQRVPSGAAHEYAVCERPEEMLGTLCRLLRLLFTAPPAGEGATRPTPRVVVFAPSADAAVDTASRLQAALWSDIDGDATAGLWGLSVLLPSAEDTLTSRTVGEGEDATFAVLESSLRVMEMFRANQTSVLVTTAAATRGLDFPQVTHVINLGIVGSAADYVHRAGRVGRIGQRERGAVLSLLLPAEVPQLLQLGDELHFSPTPTAAPEPPPLAQLAAEGEGGGASFIAPSGDEESIAAEEVAKALEDIYSLYEGEGDDDGMAPPPGLP
mmetsp:Transcript_39381/g.124224  ORF Transcript_39381/g.124224 Transcript_39381/m.124224 type:complete len:449 (+) Transcript_39381:113-1459(+)